jgi:cell division protein FtsQ
VTLPWWVSRPEIDPRAWLARLTPTGGRSPSARILAFALGAYLLARESSLFAINTIEVRGGSPQIAAQVRGALASLDGAPLVGLDGSSVLRKVDELPTVVRASYDRAFPHTLRITVVPSGPRPCCAAAPTAGSSPCAVG